MTEPIRVLIADDHPLFRDGLTALLTDGTDTELTGAASSGTEAVELARETQPDVVIMDLHMPGLNGIEATRRIVADSPHIKVLVLTMFDDDDSIFSALRAGARGYLLKDMDPDRLGPALHGVLAGEAALPRSLVSRVLEEFQGRSRRKLFVKEQRPTQLTSREWEVMELLREGLSTEEVAERLFVAPGTVRVHVSSVLKKLRVPDRAAAIRVLGGG
jgi:DNA-binding NarL/FixJ family response regulator